MTFEQRPVVLVTGVGRTVGIAAGIARQLATSGWDVASTWWAPLPDGTDEGAAEVAADLRARGARTLSLRADLGDAQAPGQLYDAVEARLGPVTALVVCHTHQADSSILDTTVESFDRHFAVNARGTWLLVREHARRLEAAGLTDGRGRVVALTGDHTTHNLPYGASKGALERIVVAAAEELGHLGISSNAVNPGPVDTGWMDDAIRASATAQTPLRRLGTPQDTADLVDLLLSPRGGWVTGQVLFSNGGVQDAQVMQCVAVGRASSLPGAMGRPQRAQVPKVPTATRARASSTSRTRAS